MIKIKIVIRFPLNKNYLVCKNIKASIMDSNRQVIGDRIGIIYLIKYIIMSFLSISACSFLKPSRFHSLWVKLMPHYLRANCLLLLLGSEKSQ